MTKYYKDASGNILSVEDGFEDAVAGQPLTSIALAEAEAKLNEVNLQRVQNIQLATIEADYQTANAAPINYMGYVFQADAASQQLIASVLTASGGALPTGFVWFDVDNVPAPMTFAQLQELAGAILLRGQPLFIAKQNRKAAIRAATTVAEVESITF